MVASSAGSSGAAVVVSAGAVVVVSSAAGLGGAGAGGVVVVIVAAGGKAQHGDEAGDEQGGSPGSHRGVLQGVGSVRDYGRGPRGDLCGPFDRTIRWWCSGRAGSTSCATTPCSPRSPSTTRTPWRSSSAATSGASTASPCRSWATRTLAEDIAQQVFERAWRHAASFEPRRGSVATWLLTITRNLAIDAVRARWADPVDPNELFDQLPRAGDADPADAAAQRAEVDDVASELALLPEEQRRAVVLAAMAGRTAVEIGELEHIPVGTAKTRLRLGMAKLRAALASSRDGSDV